MKKHFTATAYVLTKAHEPKILLVYHKKFDKWMPPGGHIEENENPLEALQREILEETGVNIAKFLPKTNKFEDNVKKLPLPQVLLEESIAAYQDQPEHAHLDLCYTIWVDSELKVSPADGDKAGWFSESDLSDLPMLKNVKRYVQKIMDRA